jgi:hypothetical protein
MGRRCEMETPLRWGCRSKKRGTLPRDSFFRCWHLKDGKNGAPGDENRKTATPIRYLSGIPAENLGFCPSPANNSRRQSRGKLDMIEK